MILAALSFIAYLFASRSPVLNRLAFFYFVVIYSFAKLGEHYAANQELYGRSWFAICMATELIIIAGCLRWRHQAATWVASCSVYNLAIHIGAVFGFGAFYDLWNQLLLPGEIGQVLAIFVFSRPIFVPLQKWYDCRNGQKGAAKWLARSTQAG